jgi:NifU-like protein
MWEYTDKVRDHFLNPRNAGEIENADGIGEVGNITCGDALRLTFKLDKAGKINDAKFKTFGCGSAIASASALTELIKGKTLEEAAKVTNADIAKHLDGLPREKMHCSVMGQEALEAAIEYYRSGGKKSAPPAKEGKVVCTCFNVTDKEIERAITDNKLKTIEDITNFTKAGGGCGGCHEQLQEMLDKINGPSASGTPGAKPVARLTTLQKIDRIRDVIHADIRPLLAKDGGDCELVDVDGNEVTIKFKGHCNGCAFSSMTLVSVVEKKLREKVADNLVVKQQE